MFTILRFILRFMFSLALLSPMVFAHAATMLPITCFTDAQGTAISSFNFGPAGCDANGGNLVGGRFFIWGKSAKSPFYRVDYAGVDAETLNTCHQDTVPTPTFNGSSIVERTLSNGKVEQTIHLETQNAVVYVVDPSNLSVCTNAGFGPSFILCPALFGFNILEMATGEPSTGDLTVVPVLANSVMDIVLINNSSGCSSIPDLVAIQSTKGVQLKSLSLTTTATGPLRAAFGVPDGTSGVATLNAVGSGNLGGFGNTTVDLEATGSTINLDLLQR